MFEWIATEYAALWLAISGGAAFGELGILLTAAIFGSLSMAAPFFLFMVVKPKWRRFTVYATIAPALFLLFTSLVMGIDGTTKFQKNFKECVQMETVTDRFDATVMVTLCRKRDHTSDPWSEWTVEAASGLRNIYIPVVDELPS